ncbi:hypothetical protein CEXT_270391 [Caerostris extrusa]|uniref:Uncharacterized protein n=1 Tax=Caerostris extrusa TaxID=172846 RepID=A0AAV4VWJ3_CAEEX|nr:hypothetical protein CEXT_270391 [Caerostris extrusa]
MRTEEASCQHPLIYIIGFRGGLQKHPILAGALFLDDCHLSRYTGPRSYTSRRFPESLFRTDKRATISSPHVISPINSRVIAPLNFSNQKGPQSSPGVQKRLRVGPSGGHELAARARVFGVWPRASAGELKLERSKELLPLLSHLIFEMDALKCILTDSRKGFEHILCRKSKF